MKYAVIALLLAVSTLSAGSQALPMIQDGRATCLGWDPDKFSVIQRGQDWLVHNSEGGGVLAGRLANREDAEAVLAVVQKKKFTMSCSIGAGDRTFRWFESAR